MKTFAFIRHQRVKQTENLKKYITNFFINVWFLKIRMYYVFEFVKFIEHLFAQTVSNGCPKQFSFKQTFLLINKTIKGDSHCIFIEKLFFS